MIKKILPAMIGASLLGGVNVAVADVTAFGHIDTSFGSRKDERLVNDDRLNNLTCTTCSIGFKGSEDLGNGLKAIFKIDFQYDTTERNKVNGNRSAAVTGVTTAVNPTTGTPVGVVGVANGNSTGSGAFTDRDRENTSAFSQTDDQHWLCDLYQLARIELSSQGVTSVFGGKECTYTDEQRFYSYRRDGDTGRMASLIWLGEQDTGK